MSLAPPSIAAAAAVAAVCIGLRWYNTDTDSDSDKGPIFFGLYVDEEGRCVICRQKNSISKHRLVLDEKTLDVGLAPWEATVSTKEIFDLWQRLDNERCLLSALSALKPLFASQSQSTRHCTFVHPYSLSPEKIQLFASALTKTEIADHLYPFTLHSAVMHGLNIPRCGWDISTIAIVLPNSKCLIATPKDRSTGSDGRRIMFPNEITLDKLTSDMRQVEQIILLDNELIPPTKYTPYIAQEPLDIIARGASLWGRRRAGTSPIWYTHPPRIGILVADLTSSAQSGVHTVLKAGSSKTGQAVVTTVVDGQTSIEVRVLYDERPLTSLVLPGLLPKLAAEVEVEFCVSVITPNEISDMFEAILQLVERESGLRVSRKVTLTELDVTWPDEPLKVALSKTQGTERPVSSDFDLLVAPDHPNT